MVDAVGEKPADLDEVRQRIDGGDAMARRLRHDALAMARGEDARHDAGAAARRLRERGIGAVDIRGIVERRDDQLQAQRPRSGLHCGKIDAAGRAGIGGCGVEQHGDAFDRWCDVAQELQPLTAHGGFEVDEAGGVAAPPATANSRKWYMVGSLLSATNEMIRSRRVSKYGSAATSKASTRCCTSN